MATNVHLTKIPKWLYHNRQVIYFIDISWGMNTGNNYHHDMSVPDYFFCFEVTRVWYESWSFWLQDRWASVCEVWWYNLMLAFCSTESNFIHSLILSSSSNHHLHFPWIGGKGSASTTILGHNSKLKETHSAWNMDFTTFMNLALMIIHDYLSSQKKHPFNIYPHICFNVQLIVLFRVNIPTVSKY